MEILAEGRRIITSPVYDIVTGDDGIETGSLTTVARRDLGRAPDSTQLIY